MKKRELATFMSNKTGININEYMDFFKKIEEKYNIDLNDYLGSKIPQDFYKLNLFKQMDSCKISLLNSDIQLGLEYKINADVIAGIRSINESLYNEAQILNKEKVNCAALNDLQKGLISNISYLDITKEGIEKINNEGLKVCELKKYLKNPDAVFVGNPLIFDKISNDLTDFVAGKDNVATDLELYEQLIKNGLGDLKITNVTIDKKTGFTGFIMEDNCNNKAISYKGTDLNYESNSFMDMVTDVTEYLTDKSFQGNQANKLFKLAYEEDKGMYLYGHSLGGNLVSHVFVDNYDKIDEAFSFCGTPISKKRLDTQEKIDAFNSEKYSYYVVAGDIFSQLKQHTLYENNVKFVECTDNKSFISCHILQVAAFDENNNFVTITKEEAIKDTKNFNKNIIEVAQSAKVKLDDFKDDFSDSKAGKLVIGAANGVGKICSFFKDEIADMGKNIKNKVEKTSDNIKDKVEDVKDELSDKFDDFKDKISDFFDR